MQHALAQDLVYSLYVWMLQGLSTFRILCDGLSDWTVEKFHSGTSLV